MPRKELSRAQLLSQFFTNDELAQRIVGLLQQVMAREGYRWNALRFVEPAAGDGAFLKYLPRGRSVGVEVDPELLERHPEYIAASLQDGGFLALDASDLGLRGVPRANIVFVGNPPYSVPKFDGRSNNVALDFVNHAASMGDTVAMILGNTFRRPTTQSKIDPRFHLVLDVDMPQKSFTMDGKPAHVTTVFQIWQAKYDARGEPILREKDPFVGLIKRGEWGGDWRYVKSTDPSANVRVCNWGSHVTVGRLDDPRQVAAVVRSNVAAYNQRVRSGESLKNYDPDQSHYYICADDPVACHRRFAERKYMFEELAQDRTMGQNPDLSYADVLRIYLTPVGVHYRQGKWE